MRRLLNQSEHRRTNNVVDRRLGTSSIDTKKTSLGWMCSIYVRLFLSTLFVFFLISTIQEHMNLSSSYPPSSETVETTSEHNDQQPMTAADLDNLDNGWISRSDILEHYSTHNKKAASLSSSTFNRYRPSLQGYPLKNLQNITTPLAPTDVIFFWHIPKASGSSIKRILTSCFQLNRALNKKMKNDDSAVGIIDTSTVAGIAHAKRHNLIEEDQFDAIVSSYLYEGSALFTAHHHGRLFTMMRHPVDTAISLFYYLGKATWEQHYNSKLATMTLLEYAQINDEELRIDNWMTRYLVRKAKGKLEEEHMKLAKSVLESKCLVGLVDHFVESMERFHSYFGLVDNDTTSTHDGNKQLRGMECVEKFNSGERANANNHAVIMPGDREWDLLAEKNRYDIELFQFANKLWDRQGKILENLDHGASWNYRTNRQKPPK